MNGFLARQLREITATVEAAGGRLVVSVVVSLVAALALLAGLAFLAVALFLKVTAFAGAVYAALAVGGAFILMALIALAILRVRQPAKSAAAKPVIKQQTVASAAAVEAAAEKAQRRAALSANIDESLAPVLDAMHQANKQPEELLLRVGAELTKQTGGFGLIALALGAGFLAARQVAGDKKRAPAP
jgi:drug/metabolite transporter superfamily protein YnfA